MTFAASETARPGDNMNYETIANSLDELYKKMEGWFEEAVQMLPNFILAILVVVFFWVLSKWVYRAVVNLFKKTHFNESLEHLLAHCCKILVILVGVVLALGVLELQKTVFSLLAGVGVIGLALGFAFQDLAANFISGIMLAIRAPIKINDVVEIDGVQGTVIEILLRETLIRNFSGQDIFIPNKDFTSSKFTNYSSFGKRKVVIDVGVGYEDDAQGALEILKDTVSKIPGALKDPEPQVYIDELGSSSVNLKGHVWFEYPGGNILQLKSDGLRLIKSALEAKGYNIPFPIRTLELGESASRALSGLGSSSAEK